MKTPIQEHIEWLKEKHKTVINHPYVEIGDCIEHAESMLEKEEVMIKYSYWEGVNLIISRLRNIHPRHLAEELISDFIEMQYTHFHLQVNDWYNKNFNTEKK